MSVDIIFDAKQGKAALYCNTTDQVIGTPVIKTCDECMDADAEVMAVQFLAFCGVEQVDVRQVNRLDLDALYASFLDWHEKTAHRGLEGPVMCEACGTVEIDGRCRCG